MHKFLVCVVALVLSAGSAAAVSLSLTTNGGNGTATDTSNPSGFFPYSFVMTGSDTNTITSIVTEYGGTAGSKGLQVEGQFSYLSADINGPFYDPFGFQKNGVFTQLTTGAAGDTSQMAQTGTFSFFVKANETFGWYIDAIDDQLGVGMASVGATITAVPLPAGVWLLVGALGALGALRRRAALRAA